METGRDKNRPILDLGLTVEDERLVIPLTVKTPDGDITRNYYFNPADIYIYQHLRALQELREPNIDKKSTLEDMFTAVDELIKSLDVNVDGIFGVGSAREIFRYSGFNQTILAGLIQRVEEGMKWYQSKVDKEEAVQKLDKIAEVLDVAQDEAAEILS